MLYAFELMQIFSLNLISPCTTTDWIGYLVREQIFIKMIEKSPGVFAIVTDLTNISAHTKEPADVETVQPKHTTTRQDATANLSPSGSTNLSSSASSAYSISGLLTTGGQVWNIRGLACTVTFFNLH